MRELNKKTPVYQQIRLPLFLLAAALILLFSNCRKERLLEDTSARLNFSTDTLTFDTVFTTLGSATQRLKVFNPYKEKVILSSAYLEKGKASNFRINVDGIPGATASEVEIGPKDSIYVFVEVTVDPNDLNSPFVIYDYLHFSLNGNDQQVVLEAWGQNAYYHYPDFYPDNFPPFSVINCSDIWVNDKPHIIFGFAVVDSLCALTIQEGTQIFLAAGASLYVYASGSLQVNGTVDNPVIFQNIRLENFFDDVPGQWGGIWLGKGSTDHFINYAIIKNAEVGIRIDSFVDNGRFDLTVYNTVIKNCLSSGFLGLTAIVDMANCLIYNCGEHNVQMELGGIYKFRNCTFANYGSSFIDHKKPVVKMSNFFNVTQADRILAPVDAAFYNCIIHGSVDEEIELAHDDGTDFFYKFDHCLVKTEMDIAADTGFVACIKNQSPEFADVIGEDYHLEQNSPAIDAGTATINDPSGIMPVSTDLDNKARNGSPDIGAYEFQ